MTTGLILLIGLGAALGALLGLAGRLLRPNDDPVVEKINDLLPQTQCAQCGFPGCRPYAQAIADGTAAINLCPPGGAATITALAALLGQDEAPLDDSLRRADQPLVALVDEDWCVGCGLCLPACPVDAIVGAQRFMHTVVSDLCTGCELCLDPCPMDCIAMVSPSDQPIIVAPPAPAWQSEERNAAGA